MVDDQFRQDEHHRDPYLETRHSIDYGYVCLTQEGTILSADHCTLKGNSATFGGAILALVRPITPLSCISLECVGPQY